MKARSAGRWVAVATAITAVVGGVATNRVEGAWWSQTLWFSGAAISVFASAWMSRISAHSNELPHSPVDPATSGGTSIVTPAYANRTKDSPKSQLVTEQSGSAIFGPGADFRGATLNLGEQPKDVTSELSQTLRTSKAPRDQTNPLLRAARTLPSGELQEIEIFTLEAVNIWIDANPWKNQEQGGGE